MNICPPLNQTDGYKIDHRSQYPKGTNLIYSNWTARKSRILTKDYQTSVFFGLQYFIKEYLIKQWNYDFFWRDKKEVVERYKRRISNYLGPDAITYEHIEQLHDLGHLPLLIKALPEGTVCPIKVPQFSIVNTHPDFFWLTNFIESIISCIIWMPCNSATIAREYRVILEEYAKKTNPEMKDFVPFQGHDFSFRGMAGLEAACMSGAAHLLSFVGTDTVPAIDFLEEYYGADSDKELIGCSVPATEHSVMSMGTDAEEFSTFKRLITEVYPKGIVSVVSDTWNLWQVLTEFLPKLKSEILNRNGKVVIRPDSGDPVKIICGDPQGETPDERNGVINLLWYIFGGTISSTGYKVLDPHVGAIYGDSISLDRCTQICHRLDQNGFASTNVVFGIGSYTYQFNTRDTLGAAVKSTYGEVNGEGREIYKDPITDDGMKKSARGLLCVYRDEKGNLKLKDRCTHSEEAQSELKTVFYNGKLIKEYTLSEIRGKLWL